VRARRQFQCFELVVAQKYQIRPRFVSIEPKLLQPSPEPLKVDFGQFFAHNHFTLAKPASKREDPAVPETAGITEVSRFIPESI